MPALKNRTAARNTARNQSFTIYLDGIKALTERLADRLYEAGCRDATIAFQNGELAIDYDRSAISLDRALARAVRDLLRGGYRISRIEVAKPSRGR